MGLLLTIVLKLMLRRVPSRCFQLLAEGPIPSAESSLERLLLILEVCPRLLTRHRGLLISNRPPRG